MQERRRFVRLDVNVTVRWNKITEGAVQVTSINKDISENGICLIVEDELSAGDTLQMEMELPTKKIIHSVGQVVWASPFVILGSGERKFNAGIEFIKLNDEDRQELGKFIYHSLVKK
jgi:c-di-GMP-binding flagellar brake protein YcgR